MLIEYQCFIDTHGKPILKSDASDVQTTFRKSLLGAQIGEKSQQWRPISGVYFKSLRYFHKKGAPDTGTGFKYLHQGVEFIQAFFLHTDLGISTALYTGRTRHVAGPKIPIETPNRHGKINKWLRKSDMRVFDDRFVTEALSEDEMENVFSR